MSVVGLNESLLKVTLTSTWRVEVEVEVVWGGHKENRKLVAR